MRFIERVCSSYSGHILTTTFYELIRQDDGLFAVVKWDRWSGGFPVFEDSRDIATLEEAREVFERAKAEMRRRFTMCVPYEQTARALAERRSVQCNHFS